MPDREFGTLPNMIRATATERPNPVALIQDRATLTYAALDRFLTRCAAAVRTVAVRMRPSSIWKLRTREPAPPAAALCPISINAAATPIRAAGHVT